MVTGGQGGVAAGGVNSTGGRSLPQKRHFTASALMVSAQKEHFFSAGVELGVGGTTFAAARASLSPKATRAKPSTATKQLTMRPFCRSANRPRLLTLPPPIV